MRHLTIALLFALAACGEPSAPLYSPDPCAPYYATVPAYGDGTGGGGSPTDSLRCRLSFEAEVLKMELDRLGEIARLSAEWNVTQPGVAAALYDKALAYGVPLDLAFRLAQVESGFDPSAVSYAGAIGVIQVMPATAWWLEPGVTHDELFDPVVNAGLGFRYLADLFDEYGDWDSALRHYNGGPRAVDNERHVSRHYAAAILSAID